MSRPGWVREIEELHVFFEDWLGAGEGDPERLERALAPDFHFIGPDGEAVERPDLMAGIRQGRGSRPGLSIEIRNPRLRHRVGDVTVATYEEWQQDPDGLRGRLSTVVFQDRADGPNGLAWLHVHETWLREEA